MEMKSFDPSMGRCNPFFTIFTPLIAKTRPFFSCTCHMALELPRYLQIGHDFSAMRSLTAQMRDMRRSLEHNLEAAPAFLFRMVILFLACEAIGLDLGMLCNFNFAFLEDVAIVQPDLIPLNFRNPFVSFF